MADQFAITPEIATALRRVLDYLMDDEAADYLATSPLEDPENHIYKDLQKLDRWLAGNEINETT